MQGGILVDGDDVEESDDFVYLGWILIGDGNKKEISRRIVMRMCITNLDWFFIFKFKWGKG